MGISRNRLSFILAGGVACTLTFAPAIGQQTTAQQQSAAQPPVPPAPAVGTSVGRGATGLTVTLDYATTLRYDENLGLDDPSLGSTSRWENTLGIGVVNQTPNSQLTFDLSGLYRYADQPVAGSNADFNDPAVRLTYSRAAANSQFNIRGEYRERDLNFNQSLNDLNQDGVIDAADLAIDRGTRTTSRVGMTWQTGINDPLGFIFSYDRFDQQFSNTTAPGLFDTLRNSYSLTSLLRISPVMTGSVTLRYMDYSAKDAARTDRQTTTLTTGITYDVSPVTTVNAAIGYSLVDETLRAIPLDTDDEGFVASFSWSKTLPNGSANAAIDRTFGTNGDRTTAQIGRTYTLQNGSFGFNAGISHGPFGENTPIADINYIYTMNASQFTASLRRRVGTSNQNVETRETVARLGYDYSINPLSNLSFRANFAEQEDAGAGPSNRRQRTDFSASYTRAITQDWNMTVGYLHRFRNNAGPGDADGSSVFLTLGRQFTLKP